MFLSGALRQCKSLSGYQRYFSLKKLTQRWPPQCVKPDPWAWQRFEEVVPHWMKEQEVTGGWLTAEYSMLPYSTKPRQPRDIAKARIDGRSVEIQRLVGRSLRAVVDLEKLGPHTIWVDCDVLQADGRTRTTAITGASLALAIACRKFVRKKSSRRTRCKN